jgi:hypothetical protein
MVNPDELVDAVRDKLKAIAGAVALVGSADRIVSFYDGGIADAVNGMEQDTILVAWIADAYDPEGFGRFCPVISIFMRLSSQSIGAAFEAILNGVADGDTESFTETEFHPGFEVLGAPERLPREQDDDRTEYPNIRMPFRERAA